MGKDLLLATYDTHAAGEPTRFLEYGSEQFDPLSMRDKRRYFKENCDQIRTSLLHEPRGHRDMFGALITKPENPGSSYGLLFMDCNGYLDCCLHGTMASANVAAELGLITHDSKEFSVDTISGTLKVARSASSKQVSVGGVTSYAIADSVRLSLSPSAEIELDIAYGGNLTACIDVDQFDSDICPDSINEFVDRGAQIRSLMNREIEPFLPDPGIAQIDLVLFYSIVDRSLVKTLTVFGDGQFDRSPCGTGSSALKACLLHKGMIDGESALTTVGCSGSEFSIESRVFVDREGRAAIRPVVTGETHITGKSTWTLSDSDPFRDGFRV